MKKYPIELQDEQKACGAFCISMILKYYGFKEEIQNIKKNARMNQNGISIKGMIECFKKYQIEAKAYEASLLEIDKEQMYPCILFMVYEGMGHFVVLYEKHEDYCLVADPARGLIQISMQEMDEHYSKRFIAIEHVGRVPKLYYQSYLSFLKENFYAYPAIMKYLIKKGLWIACIGYFSSYFFQIIVDYIQMNTAFFYVIVVCVMYGLLEIEKTYLSNKKAYYMIRLTRAFDEDYVFQSSMNMLDFPLSFFDQDKGYIQSQLLSLFDLSDMSVECFEKVFLDVVSFLVFVIGMLLINISMTVIVIFMMIIVGCYAFSRLKKLQQFHKLYLESYLRYQHHLLELIENSFLIRTFRLNKFIHKKSQQQYQESASSKQQQALFINETQTHIHYIVYAFYIVVMVYGFYMFQHQVLTMGQVMMFYMLMSYALDPLFHIVQLLSQYQYMSLIYEKYKVFQKQEKPIKDTIEDKIQKITFDNVGYSYGYQTPLFEHVDLKIDKHLLIQGSTGSGKSTLLKLLMGYDENYIGDIYMNDQNLSSIDLTSLYKHIGYMDGTPSFLHETLFDNFLCDDLDKIKYYLDIFHQTHLQEMFHIVLNEDGSPLSLGQRQVVGLIRLLCQHYDVLILDEAFCHMDQELEKRILDYLFTEYRDCLYIMVNHRTNIMYNNCDCVIIEDGKIKSKG